MSHLSSNVMSIEAQLQSPLATTQLVQFEFPEPIDHRTLPVRGYRLDLCLTPRPDNARACYLDHWNSRRFERLGNLFMQPAGEILHTRSDGCCRQTSLMCELNPEPINEWFEEDLQWTDNRLLESLDLRDANIQGILLRLAQEVRQPGIASGVMVEMMVGQLAIEITRYWSRHREPAVAGGLAPWRLRLIDERLGEIAAPPSLAELSELCRLSVRQLTRGFRVSRGCSIGDYIAASRIEHARHLLTGDQSVKAVAYSLGFASSSSFCYAFRRATGETPRQFRSRHCH